MQYSLALFKTVGHFGEFRFIIFAMLSRHSVSLARCIEKATPLIEEELSPMVTRSLLYKPTFSKSFGR